MKSRFSTVRRSPDGSISLSKVPSVASQSSSNVRGGLKKKRPAKALQTIKSEVLEGKIILDLPIRTTSEANCFEPWPEKHKRHKAQQRTVALALNPLRAKIQLPCKVQLTRFAPHELDAFDNLPMSFKYIVDAICAIITGNYVAGKADSDKRISISCGQEKSKEYGIRIEVTW